MSNIYQVTPFMHVPDLDAAVRFFTDLLGFECEFRSDIYAYVRREAAAFRLLINQGDCGAPPGNRRFCYYIDLNDLDAMIAEVGPRVAAALPTADIHGPVDQPYQMREWMLVAPDGNLLVFGQPIA